MQLNEKSNNKKIMERKKFFYSITIGFIGAFAAKNIVFKMFTSKKAMIKKTRVVKNSRVKINPLAVSRKKTGTSNG